jgi:hypothetical protein
MREHRNQRNVLDLSLDRAKSRTTSDVEAGAAGACIMATTIHSWSLPQLTRALLILYTLCSFERRIGWKVPVSMHYAHISSASSLGYFSPFQIISAFHLPQKLDHDGREAHTSQLPRSRLYSFACRNSIASFATLLSTICFVTYQV